MAKTKKPSPLVKCGGCKRPLLIAGYESGFPPKGTPAHLIHDESTKGKPTQTVMCANCGHYTIFSDS